jgi:hypothetical protein
MKTLGAKNINIKSCGDSNSWMSILSILERDWIIIRSFEN